MILVALVTFGVVCHAQMPRRVASDVNNCETQFANCKALLSTVGGPEAKDVVHLVATTTPSSESTGAGPPPFGLRCVDCMITDGPRRSGTSGFVGKNMSGTVQPVGGAQYFASSATSCAARLQDCRAHRSARRRSGAPVASRLPCMFTCLHLCLHNHTHP